MSPTMPTRRIGSLEVSVVGIGCNNFGGRIDEARTKEVVDCAIDCGINFFDTADVYGGTKSEEFLGRALGSRRKDVVVATKFGMPLDSERRGAKPAYVRAALEDSLRRLDTDHVDLYQLHTPDPETPISETLEVLDEQVKAGKVKEIGCSNFSAEQLREAHAAVAEGAARFVSVQNEYNLLRRAAEKEVLPECERTGTAFIPYYPLASGLLSGKYKRGVPPPEGTRLAGMPSERSEKLLSKETFEIVEALEGVARTHGMSLLELSVAWLLARPVVASVITGATRPEQVRANAACASVSVPPELVTQIEAIAEA
jgi:aryl-alcohol dehydrogenase-like predicted oxidoreductase